MKVIYIAGPYRSEMENGVFENIYFAREYAKAIWAMGAAVICPHLNTAFMGGVVLDQIFLDGDLEIMRRCDAVYALEGWEGSKGAFEEVDDAKERDMPVFEDIRTLKAWIDAQNDLEEYIRTRDEAWLDAGQ